ncbi:MAG: hypothetical protein ACI837_002506 [Crocinitomicaceae bacterium]|jgi:hypothetical protein
MNSSNKTSSVKWQKLTKLLVWTISAVFLIFYLILSYYNRLASDDLFIVNELVDKGWTSAIFDFEFSKRISSYVVFHSLFTLNTDLRSLHLQVFIYQIAVLIGFVTSLNYFLRNLSSRFFSCVIRSKEMWIISSTATVALFFFTFQLTEVWFWTISSVIHLVPIIAAFALLGALCSDKSSIRQYVFIFLCALFVGGGSETIALTVFSFVGIWFILVLVRKNSEAKKLQFKLLLTLGGCLILFLGNVLGAGTEARIDLEGAYDSSVYVTTFAGFIKLFVEPKIVVFLFFLPLFFLLGVHFRKMGHVFYVMRAKVISSSLVILLLAAICTFIPLLLVFDSLGPPRAWSPFGFTLGFLLLGNVFLNGNRFKRELHYGLINVPSIALIGLISIYSVRQAPQVKNYSQAYDERTEHLLDLQAKGQIDPVQLRQLPSSGMLVHSSLESDLDGWNNKQLAKILKLDFIIYSPTP